MISVFSFPSAQQQHQASNMFQATNAVMKPGTTGVASFGTGGEVRMLAVRKKAGDPIPGMISQYPAEGTGVSVVWKDCFQKTWIR